MTVYGLTIAIAVFVAFCLSRRRAPKFKISPQDIENLFLICVPFAIIGARAYHVLSELSYYQKNPIQAFYFWQGGWGIFGAIAGGIIGIFLYTRFRKINFWKILNLLAPSLVLGQAIGRIGNIVNGELLPYAIYESALDFSIFLYLVRIKLENQPTRKLANQFTSYAIIYGVGRFFLEFLRTEPAVAWGLRLNQVVCLLFVGIGVFCFYISKRKTQISNPHLKS